jgi:hypothetical protein
MDYITILSIVVVLFIAYIIYTYFFMTSMVFNKPVALKNTSPLSYSANLLKQANSPRYNYEFWVNIQANNPVDARHVILNRGTLFAFGLTGSVLTFHAAPTNIENGIITPSAASNTVEITSTFPFQKWTQILMNVDGSRIDFYIDGKLYKTINNLSIGTDRTTPVTVGNPHTVGQMNRFSYWPNTVDTQTVWSRFTQGNGIGGIASFFGKYKADMAILKDGDSVFSFSIL